MSASATVDTKTSLSVLLVLGVTHMLNDLMQSVIAAAYPVLKAAHGLDFAQVGAITLTFQVAGSLLQPVVGTVIDRRPMPYSMALAMAFTFLGLAGLSIASSYAMILAAAACVGVGSSIFHPEATRATRAASGGRRGLGQGIFQLGGQAGGALGPLLAALIVAQRGQSAIAWFASLALVAMALAVWIARRQIAAAAALSRTRGAPSAAPRYSGRTVAAGMVVLTLLMASKNAYSEGFRSFYTFYLIERFGLSVQASQVMLFLLLAAAAAGAILGGLVGDRIGRYRLIWISVLGPLPFALLLPHADLFWTGALTVLINLVMASAFASILLYAMDLLPDRIGLVGGVFYGLNFGLGGIAAAALGAMADGVGIQAVYRICSLLPLAGLLAWFLPRIDDRRAPQATAAPARL